jgi:hemolysin activation/secretion protein
MTVFKFGGVTRLLLRERQVLVATLLMASSAVFAQPSRDDVLREREQERERAQADQASAARPVLRGSGPPRRADVPTGETPCFVVTDLVIRMPPEHESWTVHQVLQEEWALTKGLCLGARGIQVLHANLQGRLRESGWFTSVLELPAQNLDSGVLAVDWRPGLVGKVNAAIGVSSLPVAEGRALRVADLDQAIDHYNRLPSLRAQMLVQPSSDPDVHDVTLQVLAGRPWRAVLMLDNSSPREYGRTQATVQVQVDRPSAWLGTPTLLDQASLEVGSNPENPASDRANRSFGVNYSLPLGQHLLALSARHGRFARRVQGAGIDFVNRGTDRNYSARWHWTAWRDAQSKWSPWLGVAHRSGRRDIEDVELVLQRQRTRSFDVGLNVWRRSSVVGRDVDWNVELTHSIVRQRGSQAPFGPTSVPSMLERRAHIGARFAVGSDEDAVAEASASTMAASRRFAVDIQLNLHSVGRPLTASDLPLIGTRYSVRGFDGDAPLQGLHAAVLRTEMSTPGPVLAGGAVQLLPYAGLDVGTVRSPPAGAARASTLSGAVLGVRVRANSVSGEVALARAVRDSPASPRRRWVPTLSLAVEI